MSKKSLNPEEATPEEVREADAETLLYTLRDEMEFEEMVNIRETPIGTKIGVQTSSGKASRFNSLEIQVAREFISQYEDLMVDLHKLDGEGVELWWKMGEKFDEHGFDEVTYEEFDVFGELIGLRKVDFAWAHKIHSVFDNREEIPEQDWSDETWVGRLAHRAKKDTDTPEEAKHAARELIDAYDSKPSKRDLRLWKDVSEMDEPTVDVVVEAAQRRFKAKYGYSEGTWVKKTKSMFRALGLDEPSTDDVKAAISDE